MRFLLSVFIVGCLANAEKHPRDVGLHLNPDHGHHHNDDSSAQSQNKMLTIDGQLKDSGFKGYGKGEPIPPLSVDLKVPEVAPQAENLALHAATPKVAQEAKPSYSKEPSNPLQYSSSGLGSDLLASDKPENIDRKTGQQESSRNEIPGEAGRDFPIFSTVPTTSFDCKDQQWPGYYADEEALCQVFHICYDNRKASFLCPNGTLFHQKHFVCDWWYNVECSASRSFFQLNSLIGVVPEKPSSPYSKENIGSLDSVLSINQNGAPQQSADSIELQPPSLDYLPPGTTASLNSNSGHEAVDTILKGGNISEDVKGIELSQSYLPPAINSVDALAETIAPIESFTLEESSIQTKQEPPKDNKIQNNLETSQNIQNTQTEKSLSTGYLPPALPQLNHLPHSSPSLNYLPPLPDKTIDNSRSVSAGATATFQHQIPTHVANVPTAMEAIVNGILVLQ